MGNRRDVQQQVGGAAKRRVKHHGVFNGFVGQDIAGRDPPVIQLAHRPRRLTGNLQPHGLPGRGERGVRQRQTQRFGHHL